MSTHTKVIWSEGLFMRPQHFQQQERYLEHFVSRRASLNGPWSWGFQTLVIDVAALSIGKLSLLRASGIFPDGTPFDLPADGALPAPLQVQPSHLKGPVYLAIPVRQPGTAEVCFDEALPSRARYRCVDASIADANAVGLDAQDVQLAELRVCLVPDDEMSGSWAGLPVANLSALAADGAVLHEAGWIPPVCACTASRDLERQIDELCSLVMVRADALAAQIGSAMPLSGAMRDASDWLVLQILNRFDAVLSQHLVAGSPPELVYRDLVALAAELGTYLGGENRRRVYHARRYPRRQLQPYRHDAPHLWIGPLAVEIRQMLSIVRERGARRVTLDERPHGLSVATLEMAERANPGLLIIALAATSSAVSPQSIARQMKVGPAGRIADLIGSHLPGIGLRQLPVAPASVPPDANAVYLALDPEDGLWVEVREHGKLAFHVAGRPAGLDLQLWSLPQA